MPKFLRDNPTLVFGLVLPLILILVFVAANAIQNIGGSPPKYAVIFQNNNINTNNPVITVENNKIKLTYYANSGYYYQPQIYYYDPVKNTAHQIAVNMPVAVVTCSKNPSACDKNLIIPIPVPELDSLKLDTSTISPDGFQFVTTEARPSTLLEGLFFFDGSYRNSAVLQKGSYRVLIPQNNYYGGLRFLAWVIPNDK